MTSSGWTLPSSEEKKGVAAPEGHERLFNLTCALLTTKRGLTKQEIFSAVQGYREQQERGASAEAMERMFERDKTTMRESGIQILAENPYYALGDNQEIRYRIPSEEFSWAAGVSLTGRQLALLQLAAKAWSRASMSNDASVGLMRLRALGESLESSELVGIAPRLSGYEPAFLPLTEAIDIAAPVRFDYRKASSQLAETREVEPWALFQMSDQWLLVGWDRAREERRNFLLRRIIGKVHLLEGTFDKPSAKAIDTALTELEALRDRQVARLRVNGGGAAAWHFGIDAADGGEIELHYFDLELLAEQLREYLGEIEVLSPEALRDRIRAGLEQVVNLHHG